MKPISNKCDVVGCAYDSFWIIYDHVHRHLCDRHFLEFQINKLPIKSNPMKSTTASTNPGNRMSVASTDKSWRPAKKKAVVAKKKKVVKAKKK